METANSYVDFFNLLGIIYCIILLHGVARKKGSKSLKIKVFKIRLKEGHIYYISTTNNSENWKMTSRIETLSHDAKNKVKLFTDEGGHKKTAISIVFSQEHCVMEAPLNVNVLCSPFTEEERHTFLRHFEEYVLEA